MWRLFFAKKKVKDPMLDGFKKILQRNFQFKESFLRSAGENNAHWNLTVHWKSYFSGFK